MTARQRQQEHPTPLSISILTSAPNLTSLAMLRARTWLRVVGAGRTNRDSRYILGQELKGLNLARKLPNMKLNSDFGAGDRSLLSEKLTRGRK